MSLSLLARYMDRSYQWKLVDLQGSVVIKGDSLCYHLYFKNHMWQCGGHYVEFYKTVVEFFRKLKHLPYVVMNGALTNEKTYKERCIERLGRITSIRTSCSFSVHQSVLPLFAKTVFIDALRDLKVKLIIADGDGDPVCVSLANGMNCPVLGDDADFFIFNIEGGYVPLYDIRGQLIDLSERVRCYNYKSFDTQVGICHTGRLYLAVLLNRHTKRSVESIIASIQSGDIKEQLPLGSSLDYSFYRHQSSAMTFSELVQPTQFNSRIPHWILNLYRQGEFSYSMMLVLVCKVWRYSNVIEDTRKSSAWSVTVKPRRFIMGALSQLLEDRDDLSDTKRTGIPFDLEVFKVKLREKHHLDFPLEKMPDRDKVERQEILIRAFNCGHIKFSLGKVPCELKLAVVACRAWLKTNVEKFEPLITPLVFCILSCSGKFPMPSVSPGNTLEERDGLDRLHSLAQWQCMLHHVIALNQLLDSAFPYTSPAKLFSCSVVDHFVQHPTMLPMEQLPSVMMDVISIK